MGGKDKKKEEVEVDEEGDDSEDEDFDPEEEVTILISRSTLLSKSKIKLRSFRLSRKRSNSLLSIATWLKRGDWMMKCNIKLRLSSIASGRHSSHISIKSTPSSRASTLLLTLIFKKLESYSPSRSWKLNITIFPWKRFRNIGWRYFCIVRSSDSRWKKEMSHCWNTWKK